MAGPDFRVAGAMLELRLLMEEARALRAIVFGEGPPRLYVQAL
jgi:hypothetical protein